MSSRAFPIISVRDLPAVRRFYEQLGFVQTYQFPPEGAPEFVAMDRAGSSIGIGAGGVADEDRFGYWVYVDDVDATLAAPARGRRSGGGPARGPAVRRTGRQDPGP